MDNQNQNQNPNDNNKNNGGKWPFLIGVLAVVVIMMFAGSKLWGSISNQFSEEIS